MAGSPTNRCQLGVVIVVWCRWTPSWSTPPRACAVASVRPATNQSHIGTRCSPRLPKGRHAFAATPPAVTASQRFGASAGLVLEYVRLGRVRAKVSISRSRDAVCVGSSARAVRWTPAIPGAQSGCCRESSPLSHSRHPLPEMTPCAGVRCAGSSCRSSEWARASGRRTGVHR